jgi:hypothetical protein
MFFCALLAFFLSGLVTSMGDGAEESGASGAQPGRFDRPPPDTIRTEIHNVLADRRFSHGKTFMQWLVETLAKWWPESKGAAPSGWGKILLIALLVWCVLTLIAILIHFVWTLTVLLGGFSRGSRLRSRHPMYFKEQTRSLAELRELSFNLAREGRFREALGVLMGALLRLLDDAQIVRFHESKTNGDYVREYGPSKAGRDTFRGFVLTFDRLIYGGFACGADQYESMNSLFEQVLVHVRQGTQV